MAKQISVVIPTFDRKRLTDQAVDSVVATEPDSFEIVVVDDAGTLPYMYEASRNPAGIEVAILRSITNRGPGFARKLGVAAARGRLICFLDSDDVFKPGWPDAVLEELLKSEAGPTARLFIAGQTEQASIVQSLCVKWLASLRPRLQSTAVRLVTIAFNPFYTPATAMSKSLCQFWDESRFCEDYFTNAMAIFASDTIHILPVTACKISRSPGSAGGISQSTRDMLNGEHRVRVRLLHCSTVPVPYRLLVPLGMLYSRVRGEVKSVAEKVRGRYSRANSASGAQ
ncbi:MAG: glycosyltransferase family 2 protein [Terracidiphilus sp.]